jgi:carboxymethylenebutenolidase
MRGTRVEIKGHDGAFSAYLAKPAGTPKAGMVVIQEIFGVNANVRAIADGYAAEGYVAIAPDLFWRLQREVQLTDKTKEEMDQAFALMKAFDVEKGVEDIDATIDYLRDVVGAQKVGAVGFCLGGLLSFLTATHTDVDAAVVYYAVNMHERLDETDKLAKPLMLHIAGKDRFVPRPAQDAIIAALHNHPQITIHRYENQDHAFARINGEHFDEVAAELANRRTADFFAAKLSA